MKHDNNNIIIPSRAYFHRGRCLCNDRIVNRLSPPCRGIVHKAPCQAARHLLPYDTMCKGKFTYLQKKSAPATQQVMLSANFS
jgi:hypothetical protein